MRTVKSIAILTSGGDAPGMNAAVRAAAMIAHSKGVRVHGIRRGYRGLLEEEFVDLSPSTVASIFRSPARIASRQHCCTCTSRR